MFSELDQLKKYLVCGKCCFKLILPHEFNAMEPITNNEKNESYFYGFSSCTKCKYTYKIEYLPTDEEYSNSKKMGNGRKVITKINLKDHIISNIFDDYVEDIKIVRLLNTDNSNLNLIENKLDENYDDKYNNSKNNNFGINHEKEFYKNSSDTDNVKPKLNEESVAESEKSETKDDIKIINEEQLQNVARFCDVILACEDKQMKIHKSTLIGKTCDNIKSEHSVENIDIFKVDGNLILNDSEKSDANDNLKNGVSNHLKDNIPNNLINHVDDMLNLYMQDDKYRDANVKEKTDNIVKINENMITEDEIISLIEDENCKFEKIGNNYFETIEDCDNTIKTEELSIYEHIKDKILNFDFTSENENNYDIGENNSINISDSKAHINMSHIENSEVQEYACDLCSETFIKMNDLLMHKQTVHVPMRNILSLDFNCSICGLDFQSSLDLQKHQEYISNEKLYSCDICYFQAEYNIDVQNHRDSMHNLEDEADFYDLVIEPEIIALLRENNLNPYPFENEVEIEVDDPLEMSEVVNLNEENEIKIKTESIYHEILETELSQFDDMDTNIIEHPIKSKLMAKYKEKLRKSEHQIENDIIIRSIKLESQRIRFSCDYCDKVFNLKIMLNIHMISKQQYFDQTRSFVEYKYIQNRDKCDKCDNSCDRRYGIKDHKITLHKEEEYSCDLCYYNSKQKEHLKTKSHMNDSYSHLKVTKHRFKGVYFQFKVENEIRNIGLKIIKEWKKRRKKKRRNF